MSSNGITQILATRAIADVIQLMCLERLNLLLLEDYALSDGANPGGSNARRPPERLFTAHLSVRTNSLMRAPYGLHNCALTPSITLGDE